MTLTSASLSGRAHDVSVADDLAARPRRPTFTAEYKARILAEHDAIAAGSPDLPAPAPAGARPAGARPRPPE